MAVASFGECPKSIHRRIIKMGDVDFESMGKPN